MSDNEEYDQGLTDIRMKLALDKNDWFTYFKIRDKYIKLMIFSFFVVWAILAFIAIIFDFNPIFLFVVPNIAWLVFCAPYFIYKLYNMSKLINIKKEEVVINIWNSKTHDIKEIMLITGLERIFVEYYLKKNKLLSENDLNTS